MTFDGPYGVYHSAYDNHYWISKIGDPGFRYHTLMSQFWGTLALRLANADVLPYRLDDTGREPARVRAGAGPDSRPGRTTSIRARWSSARVALRTTARRLEHLRVDTALAPEQLSAGRPPTD